MSLKPLVVDLDGTLLKSDLLVESGFAYLKSNVFQAFAPLLWLNSGKAYLKEQLAQRTSLDVTVLPYNQKVIAFIEGEREKGREIVLATASHAIYAEKIAEHLQLFDHVYATCGDTNLSAHKKRDRLVELFGEKGFDYMGNSKDDLYIWQAANCAHVVCPEAGVESKAKALGNVGEVIAGSDNQFKMWVKQLRLHQWVKNLLLFVALLASHQAGDIDLVLNGAIAFILFGLCASSVYVLNDLLDLEDDRHHVKKRKRPFASGALSIKSGLLVAPAVLAVSFIGAFLLLPWGFTFVLAIYYFLTVAYSMYLKRKVMVDVITLAMLYTIRIIAGAFAFGIALTFWMLTFSMFIFLSLAFVKRYAELMDARLEGKQEMTRGRGYYPSDLEMISSLGASSGYISVMVLALYIQEITTVALYSNPQVIWLSCPVLLFWVSRVWFLTHRGEMHDDPIVFAIKDRVSLFTGGLFGVIFWLAA